MPKLNLSHIVVAGLAALCLGCLSCRRPKAPSTDQPGPPAIQPPDRPAPAQPPAPSPAASKTAPPAAVWSFEGPTLPAGFAIKGGAWAVELESKPGRNRVLVQTATSARPAFNVVLLQGPEAKVEEVDLTVRLRAVAGKVDQGGGLIWRARDVKNYYIARYNPLEDNLRLYSVKAGHRKLLKGTQLKVNHTAWHTLRVTMQKDRIKVYLDNQELLSLQDSTFGEAGQIGLWTKADAVTQFDDLKLKRAQP